MRVRCRVGRSKGASSGECWSSWGVSRASLAPPRTVADQTSRVADLAQEILEDVSPDELEEIEECFGLTDAERDREDETGEEADVQAMALEA